MCKEGWCVGLGQVGVTWGWRGDCLKYLKRGCNRKEGRGKKDFKKGWGKLGQGVGALKRGGLEPPYELWWLLNYTIKIEQVWTSGEGGPNFGHFVIT